MVNVNRLIQQEKISRVYVRMFCFKPVLAKPKRCNSTLFMVMVCVYVIVCSFGWSQKYLRQYLKIEVLGVCVCGFFMFYVVIYLANVC